jgi:hypothetical protein
MSSTNAAAPRDWSPISVLAGTRRMRSLRRKVRAPRAGAARLPARLMPELAVLQDTEAQIARLATGLEDAIARADALDLLHGQAIGAVEAAEAELQELMAAVAAARLDPAVPAPHPARAPAAPADTPVPERLAA